MENEKNVELDMIERNNALQEIGVKSVEEMHQPSDYGSEMSKNCVDGMESAGKAISPHGRGCGKGHPMKGTNSEDLREWCGEHQV